MASNQMSNQYKRSGSSQGSPSGRHSEASHSNREDKDQGVLGTVASRASDYWARSEECTRDMVEGREGTAILMSLAAGFGVGLVIGAALGRSFQEQQTWRDRMRAEGFGRRLMDRIESMIPDALAEHFGK
jgi:hypothetical protein